MRDINDKIKTIVDEKVSKTIEAYADRMSQVESDLKKRSEQVLQNQKDIEETNIIHSLWIRASQETTFVGKIEIYDEILAYRPTDAEVLTSKSEATLALGEANWALNLSNQAISVDGEYANAFYQRAKVYSVLESTDNAIDDLIRATDLNEQYKEELVNEEHFISLLDDKRIKKLLS